jgi:membrane-associated phospholipid phosphatase
VLAQVDTTAGGRTIIPRDTANAEHRKTLFTYRDAILAAGFTGLTVAMFPLDRKVAEKLQNPDVRANKFFDKSATGVELITTPGSFIIGGGLYAAGKLMGNKDIADLGWHGTEAVLLGSAVTNILKGTLGRARPYVHRDTNPRDFSFLRGFGKNVSGIDPTSGKQLHNGDFQSFPSGHTTTAFAAAAAVTSETRRLWPEALWIVAPAMYGGATLVGLSRMYHNNHWASDVVLGAAIGTFSGLKVVRYSHAHPDNKIDRVLLGATLMPTIDGGGVLAFSFAVP